MNTSENAIKLRDVFYFRQRYKNRVFTEIIKHFANEARDRGITKKDLAERLGRDPAQVSRWLKEPSNLTLETISDLLLAMDAEPDPPLPIGRFSDRAQPNYSHPLIARIMGAPPPLPKTVVYGETPLPSSDVRKFSATVS